MSGAQRQVRGEKVVEKVLEATLEELAITGYAALSIEDVAQRAGVAKTTVYRRWPTKREVVHAAMLRVADDFILGSNTGSIRSDLIAMLKGFRDFMSTPRGASLVRTLVVDNGCSELSKLTYDIRMDKEAMPLAVVARAIKRGELPRGTDPKLLLDTLFASVQNSVLFLEDVCDDQKIAQLVDLVLVGAENAGGRRLRRAR
jgi:AcrR family transcriptional regulator